MNTQNVADALQKYNLKKAGIQKALDSLSDSGQISFKEYGKQKIYLARQDQFDIPNAEELDQMKKANSKLQEELQLKNKTITEVDAGGSTFILLSETFNCTRANISADVIMTEIRVLQSNLTLAEIRTKESKLRTEVT